jgi:hypothetical protein
MAQINNKVKECLLNFERKLPVDQFSLMEFTQIFDKVDNLDLRI